MNEDWTGDRIRMTCSLPVYKDQYAGSNVCLRSGLLDNSVLGQCVVDAFYLYFFLNNVKLTNLECMLSDGIILSDALHDDA